MKKKEILLDYLKSQSGEWFISSLDLAKILGVTDRSIRYYVKQLNEEVPDLIEASRDGYRYNQKYQHFVKIDESIDGRRFSILRRLLQNADEGVNLFELADELWVSEATIRQDITVLQEMMGADDLVINQHDFNYYLTGEIEAKRHLMMRVIRKQGGMCFLWKKKCKNF